jgi:hypothetical protein
MSIKQCFYEQCDTICFHQCSPSKECYRSRNYDCPIIKDAFVNCKLDEYTNTCKDSTEYADELIDLE